MSGKEEAKKEVKKPAKGTKRKSSEDDVEVVGEKAEKKQAAKKPKKEVVPGELKPIKLKAFTPEEERVALGASMERNEAIAQFLDGVKEAYKQSAEYIKAAAMKKAAEAMRLYPKPIRVAQEMAALQGCGKGTVEKVAEFLSSLGQAEKNLAGQHAAQMAEAGKEPEDEWIKDSEREVLLGLLKSKELTFEKVKAWRSDIEEADFKE